MGAKARLLVTLIMLALVSSAISSMDSPFGDDIAGFVIVIGSLLIMLGYVWNWGNLPLTASAPEKPTRESEKAKRTVNDKIALLRELLDDDELEAVKARLMADVTGSRYHDDGELPLSALLDQDARKR